MIKKVLEEGKNVLFLAPEIALASQLTMRLIKRFNQDEIAIWHSSISDGEKFDVWNKIRNNEIRIIIGARSSVFAPLKNIGFLNSSFLKIFSLLFIQMILFPQLP